MSNISELLMYPVIARFEDSDKAFLLVHLTWLCPEWRGVSIVYLIGWN